MAKVLHDRRAGRRDQFRLNSRGVYRRIFQQLDRRRCGNGKRSVRALHGSPADVERRTNNLIHPERLDAHSRANNIDQRVYGADFVEMNLLDGHVMNLRFRRAQRPRKCSSPLFFALSEIAALAMISLIFVRLRPCS